MPKTNKPPQPQPVEKPTPQFIPSQVSNQILGGTQPASLVALEQRITHSGPLPTPEIIAGYEKVLAGSADRIFKMAEKEQDYRHSANRRNQTIQTVLTLIGQGCAFLVSVLGIGGGIYLVNNNKSIAGFGVFFTSLASLIGLFFYFTGKSDSNAKKRKASTPPEM